MLLYLIKRVAEGSGQEPLSPPTPTPFAAAVARSEKGGMSSGMGLAGKGAGVTDGLVSEKAGGGGGVGHGRAAVRDASDLASLEASIAEGGGRRCVCSMVVLCGNTILRAMDRGRGEGGGRASRGVVGGGDGGGTEGGSLVSVSPFF